MRWALGNRTITLNARSCASAEKAYLIDTQYSQYQEKNHLLLNILLRIESALTLDNDLVTFSQLRLFYCEQDLLISPRATF